MIRLSAGIASIVLSTLLAAHALGLVPDRQGAVADGRRHLAEALAVQCSLSAQDVDLTRVRAGLRAVLQRNPDLLSVAIRTPDGRLILEAGARESAEDAGDA